MLCDVCGKDKTMPDGTSFYGVEIKVGIYDTVDESSRQWYAEQMVPYEVGRRYAICFPCWLHSLGIRPDCPVDNPVPGDPLIVY